LISEVDFAEFLSKLFWFTIHYSIHYQFTINSLSIHYQFTNQKPCPSQILRFAQYLFAQYLFANYLFAPYDILYIVTKYDIYSPDQPRPLQMIKNSWFGHYFDCYTRKPVENMSRAGEERLCRMMLIFSHWPVTSCQNMA